MTIPWPIQAPRRVRDTSLELLVTKLLRQPDAVSAAQIAAAVHRIYGWFEIAGPIRNQLQRLLDVMDTIDTIKQEVVGYQHASVISNMLAVSLARLGAVRLPLDESYLKELGQFVESLRLSQFHGWLYFKAGSFYKSYVAHHYAVHLLKRQMPADEEAAEQLAAVGIKDGERVISELATALAEHRAYGVKPCLFQDGILHSNEDAWVFVDGYDVVRDIDSDDRLELTKPLALAILAARSEIGHLEPTRVAHRAENLDYAGVEFDFRSKLMAAIGVAGEFTTDVGIGAVSLRECFVQADRTVAYTLFRIIQLLRLYNLIVPQYVAPGLAVPAWPVLPKGHRERDEHRQRWRAGLRDLVLPRLRVLGDPAAVRLALQREMADAMAETERLDREPTARHSVTGFVRPLPAGCTATERARQLAWEERGISLSEGETYVRTHQRGQAPNPALGHRTKLRN